MTREEWDKLTPDEQWAEYQRISKQVKPLPIFGFDKMVALAVKSILPMTEIPSPPNWNPPTGEQKK